MLLLLLSLQSLSHAPSYILDPAGSRFRLSWGCDAWKGLDGLGLEISLGLLASWPLGLLAAWPLGCPSRVVLYWVYNEAKPNNKPFLCMPRRSMRRSHAGTWPCLMEPWKKLSTKFAGGLPALHWPHSLAALH